MSKQPLTAAQLRFIDDLAALLVPWGMPLVMARLYGYLLLASEPVSLDRIATDLEASKSSISVAARLLERYQMARRHGERGSKRALYGPAEHPTGFLSEQSFLLGAMGRLLREQATSVTSGIAVKRVAATADFYLSMHDAMQAMIRKAAAPAFVTSVKEHRKP